MKKLICLALCAVMLFTLCACGAKTDPPAQETPAQETPAAPEQTAEWTRSGYFTDENENMLSVTWMEDVDEPGWYVGVMLGELMAGGTLPQEGKTLRGSLSAMEEGSEPIAVTVSEDGADDLLLVVEGGERYHFTPYDMPDATIFVSINTEGPGGMIGYNEGEETPEIDPEWPYQSAQINLAEPATYTLAAAPEAGSMFVKWTKNGVDFSTEPVITVLLDESADYVAVFEADPGWQNPVMNFVGKYSCERARALVECSGNEDAWITIEWGGSARELARWDIVGRLDPETLTVSYSGCTKQIVTYDDDGEIKSQEPEYEDGSGTVVFHNDGTFIWHEDQSESGADMVFSWIPTDLTADRQDGERFEAVIFLEGMEETVPYEHIVNKALGFEMDYDYESFVRHSDPERERFISVWDDPGNPENFLEVTHSAEDADTAAAKVRAELSQTYDLLESTRALDRAGECIYIEASVLKGTNTMADRLQAVYIIPAPDGCFIAAAHYAIEAAEGFGRRFAYMLHTFSVL